MEWQTSIPRPSGLPALPPGAVWLVGAGPGDPGLLTLHALNALAQADVVVHDALVDPRVLELAPGARLEKAGKRGGAPSARQADITARLVALAREGRRVVRLKGGDPFVFGRGAEEAEALLAAGIPLRVVPGVTAGIGGLASAGVPVTLRETAQAVTFVTGHDRHGKMPEGLDWAALARGSPVIVAYMALRTLPEIAAALIAGGRNPGEPVAIVADATLPGERVIDTTLACASADLAEAGLAAPAIVCIGPVAAWRGVLAAAGGLVPRAVPAPAASGACPAV